MNQIPNKEDLENCLDHCLISFHFVSANGIIPWTNKSVLNVLGHSNSPISKKRTAEHLLINSNVYNKTIHTCSLTSSVSSVSSSVDNELQKNM